MHSDVSTTKMSSKGQVVIPEEIRAVMHLETGVKFVVMAVGDSIIFKKITPLPDDEIKHLLKASRDMATKYHFKEDDLSKVKSEVRASKKKKEKK